MKSIVFDNAGTILRRVTVLKNMSTNEFFFETNTIGMVNENDNTLIVVFQTPTIDLIQNDMTIFDYMNLNKNSFEISYSNKKYTKDDVLDAIRDNPARMDDIRESAIKLVETYDIEICSGSAMIVDMKEKSIDYVYTAGGLFFEDTLNLFKRLEKLPYSIYIASCDNKQSLMKIASILNIPKSNVNHTCNVNCKQKVVSSLQENNELVIMVGNQTNDLLAIEQADIGILSTQQGEELPENLINSADFVIDKLSEVLKIVEKEV